MRIRRIYPDCVGEGFCPSRAGCNRRIARIFGETVKHPVGADDPVRPWGNGKFAATCRKKRNIPRHAVGEGFYPSRARCTIKNNRTPGAFVPCRRGIFVFVIAYRREGQSPSPTQIWWYLQITQTVQFAGATTRVDVGIDPYKRCTFPPMVRPYLRVHTAGRTEASAPTGA